MYQSCSWTDIEVNVEIKQSYLDFLEMSQKISIQTWLDTMRVSTREEGNTFEKGEVSMVSG